LTVLVPSWSYESRSSAVAVFPFLLPIFARSIANLDAPTTGSAAPFSPPSTTWALVLAFDRDVGDLEVGKPGDEGTVEFDLLG
jgi:hypothetical protein